MKSNTVRDFKTICSAFTSVLTTHPLYLGFVSLMSLALGLILALNTLILDHFFTVVGQYAGGDIAFKGLLASFALLIGIILANPVFNGINTVFAMDYERKVIGKLEKRFNEKCGRHPSQAFECTDFLDDIEKSHKGVKNTVSLVMSILDAFLVYIPYFIVIGIYLYRLKATLLLIIVLFSFPVIFSQMFKSKLYAKLEDTLAPMRRVCDHYSACIVDKRHFKETRMLGAYPFFIDKYKKQLKTLNDETLATQLKSIKVELIFRLPVLLGHVLTLVLLVKYLVDGSITVGNFGAILASIAMLMSMIEQMVYYVIGNAMKQMGSVHYYLKFMKTQETWAKAVDFDQPPTIDLKDVSFTYPASNQEALSNLSLQIKAKETIAIVGENGSGKSTLVNVIAGLYKPCKGSVFYNQVDTGTIDSRSMMKNTSSVFQDYQRYKMTLKDNILISDTTLKPREAYLDQVLDHADIEVTSKTFSQGLKTMLSREFDGVELSGGQWQKVAIARGLYRQHGLMILDEPTSAIDPVEESKLFMKFMDISKEKTSLIVTHRLALCQCADRIIVMDQGKIVQMGHHKSLIHTKGKYQELYQAQSQWYVEALTQ